MTDPSDRLPGGYLCPACGAAMTPSAPCPRCGRGPDAQAPRLVALDRELAGLAVRIEQSRRQLTELDGEWHSKSAERHEIARAMMTAVAAERAAVRVPVRSAVPVSAPVSGPVSLPVSGPSPVPVHAPASVEAAMPWAGANRAGTSDASPRAVQNLLFVLGGVLLGIGAIVFTLFAWSRYGIGGKMAILAGATLLALAIPVAAVRRRLRATAETFAAIGLLLVLLDGWGLYRLTHIDMSGPAYWATVFAVIAGFSAAYGPGVGLAGPRFVAVAAAQPILMLIVAANHPNAAGIAAAFAVTAALDLAFIARFRPPPAPATTAPAAAAAPAANAPATTAPDPLAPGSGFVVPRPAPVPMTVGQAVWIFAGIFGGVNLAVASIISLVGMLAPVLDGAVRESAGVFALCALILFGATVRVRSAAPRALGVGVSLVGLAISGGRMLSLAWPDHRIAVAAIVAAAVTLVAYAVRDSVTLGAGFRAAGWTVAGFTALAGTDGVLPALLLRLAGQHPWWTARLPLDAPAVTVGSTLAIAVAAGCATLLVGARGRGRAALLAVLPVALALGVTQGTRWWVPAVVDVVAAAAVLAVAAVAARRDRRAVAVVGALVGGALLLHAALVAQVRPELSAAVLGAIAALAAAIVGFTVRRRDPAMVMLASGGLAVGLCALPPAVASAVAAITHGATPPMRAALAAALVGLIVGVAVRRREDLRGYVVVPVAAITIAVALTPLFATTSHERISLYAMTGRLIIALTVVTVGLQAGKARRAMLPGDALGLFALGRVIPLLATVAVLPYGWLGHIWAGVPAGTGLTPVAMPWTLDRLDILTAALAAASFAAGGWAWLGRRGAYAFGVPALSAALLVGLAAAGAPWPVVPAAALALGAGVVLVAALVRAVDVPAGVVISGLILAGAGLCALLAARESTLVGLAVVVIASVTVAWAGRSTAWRAAGWAVAAVFGNLLVVAAIKAGDLDVTVYGVLAVALVLSVLAPQLRRMGREPVETRALDAVAQAGAFTALALSGSLARAAVCACAWGVLVGVRALWPDVPVAARRVLLTAATGLELIAWWLIAADRGLGLVDTYTVPLAAVALFAGWQAARTRPTLSSWAAYGPALFALLGPGIAPTFVADPPGTRRLVFAAIAVAVVLIGAQTRLQAPVVIGSIALGLLALHELVLIWQHAPAWIPLTVAGLLMILVAATYERRRRDWRNLKGMLGRMS